PLSAIVADEGTVLEAEPLEGPRAVGGEGSRRAKGVANAPSLDRLVRLTDVHFKNSRAAGRRLRTPASVDAAAPAAATHGGRRIRSARSSCADRPPPSAAWPHTPSGR